MREFAPFVMMIVGIFLFAYGGIWQIGRQRDRDQQHTRKPIIKYDEQRVELHNLPMTLKSDHHYWINLNTGVITEEPPWPEEKQ